MLTQMEEISMLKNRIPQFAAGSMVAVSAIALTLMGGCGHPEAKPTITVSMGSYTAQNSLFDMFITPAYAATSGIKLCFKRVRFKKDDDANEAAEPDADIDFQPGEISLSSASGTKLS